MTDLEKPAESIETIPTVTSIETVARNVSSRKTRKIKFHAYDATKNCRDHGKEHKYVNRGTYFKCTRCGSSRTIKPNKAKVN